MQQRSSNEGKVQEENATDSKDVCAAVGYVPGGFDMFHIGHLNILRKARERCEHLVVGVATDESLVRMKGRPPVVPLAERIEIISSLRLVDEVVTDIDLNKQIAWRRRPFDVLFKGDDWKGTDKGHRLEEELAAVGARVEYLPYTPTTSSTLLRQFLTREVSEENKAGIAHGNNISSSHGLRKNI
ncbi:adenylyltransferase/cytidyltransferase family protein [Corynebacterium cystitidis]|uniref:adenylyltransferase/cytidyltransferase family protein n=1 Tax=Corynebacterium cystitidis TaxID=35757 RepID=UPI00211DB8A7|nr:adenylyltransferase/cytidyltransferase family protein [Corynebacterium cystitidis]